MDYNDKKSEIKRIYRELLHFAYPLASQRDLKRVRKAYELVLESLGENWDENSIDDVAHSVEVAKIITNDIRLGIPSIIASLLHHLLIVNKISISTVKKHFGVEVARILEDYLAVSNLDTGKLVHQPDHFFQLYIALVKDFRAILLKLAHRLYNVRTLDKRPDEIKQRILNEVFHVYIPVTHRLGLYNIKREMENLWLKHSHPEEYENIKCQIKESQKKQEVYIQDFIRPIERELFTKGFKFKIKQRTKSIYSIWRKMKAKNVGFEEVFDFYAIRIIIDVPPEKEKAACWQVYSMITNLYKPEPERLRDWISIPKPNGYESLHITVLGPNDKWVEVQIRTERMDYIAENGLAAHWIYKEGGKKKEQVQWLNDLKALMSDTGGNATAQSVNYNVSVSPENIFVFTPEGDVKRLPQNATVLDFAYSIHTSLGEMCIGARVNGKHVPIRHRLKSGDKVEIITSKNQTPNPNWLSFVVSPRAKAKIKKYIKNTKRLEAQFGKELLFRRMKNHKLPVDDIVINRLVKDFNLSSSQDLFYLIALEKIDFKDIKERLEQKNEPKTQDTEQLLPAKQQHDNKSSGNLFIANDNVKGISYQLAKCCNPSSGDPVFGFISVGKGIVIHKLDCPNARQLLNKYNYRIVDVKWKQSDDNNTILTTINIQGEDEKGLLNKITGIISNNMNVDMKEIKLESTPDGIFHGNFSISVQDKNQIDKLINKLRGLDGIKKVSRVC